MIEDIKHDVSRIRKVMKLTIGKSPYIYAKHLRVFYKKYYLTKRHIQKIEHNIPDIMTIENYYVNIDTIINLLTLYAYESYIIYHIEN